MKNSNLADSFVFTAIMRSIGGRLIIDVDTPIVNIGSLLNEKTTSDAHIDNIYFKAQVGYINEDIASDDYEFRDPKNNDLSEIVYKKPKIGLRGQANELVEFEAENGENFTLKEIINAIEKTEVETRANADWFDGIDIAHIYFEGLHAEEDGFFRIIWGS